MNERKEIGLKASAYAALALAFASFGDAFLYPFLPVNFADAGVPVMWVGLLLSINRFVRILSNTMIVHAFAKYGLRAIMIVAVVLAIFSTLGYGIAASVVMWLLFRVVWGLAFSAMRIGTLAYALQNERPGFALGLSRSLQESGPMFSLFLAPLLVQYFHAEAIFYVLTFLSLPALYFAISLPAGNDKTQSLQHKWFLKWPSSLNSITLISAIVIDGIVVVVLGVLFLQFRDQISISTATALAAFYLGYRRVCSVVLSPAGGWIADKIGLDRVFNISVACVILGLIVLAFGWIGAGAVIVFTFYSINSAITPGSASKTNSHSLAGVAENSTWRDIGAALGTLIGGLLISSTYLDKILLSGIAAMIILFLIHLGTIKPIFKRVLSWK
jgi:DHA1 family multidrug resistance protein-like MFS transporter